LIALDASALILLDQLGLVRTLVESGLDVRVPKEALDEAQARSVVLLVEQGFLKPIVCDLELVPIEFRPGLGSGESSVLAAGIARPETWLVIDEKLGRAVARALGLRLAGTASLLSFMCARGIVTNRPLRTLLQELRDAGFWIDDAVIVRALSAPPPDLSR
jgi:predicted nucleic acid-binding protein